MNMLSEEEWRVVCGGGHDYRCHYLAKNAFDTIRGAGKIVCNAIGAKKLLTSLLKKRNKLPGAAPTDLRKALGTLASTAACNFIINAVVDFAEIDVFNCTDI